MRRLHIWFLFCIAVLVLIPTVGLGVNSARILLGGATSADEAATEATIPERVDEFIQTHFGFREDMAKMNRDLKTYFSDESPRVLRGQDDWLFLTDGDALGQLSGQRVDVEAVGRLTAMLNGLAEDSSPKQRSLLVVVAPEKQTIYSDKLPRWVKVSKNRTELDILLGQLRGVGINGIDLRPTLRSRVADRSIYWRGDTHWTHFGAALAFNDMVAALGLPQHRLDVDALFGPERALRRRGDLVGMLGLEGDWPETHSPPVDPEFLSLDGYGRTVLRTVGRSETFRLRHKAPSAANRDGPKVLVIGDSFSETFFGPLFMRFASEFVWTHRRLVTMDQPFVDEVDPDIIVFETVERTLNAFR